MGKLEDGIAYNGDAKRGRRLRLQPHRPAQTKQPIFSPLPWQGKGQQRATPMNTALR
jgi:hypothetical protein